MSLGANIRELRKERGLTQEALGKMLDMSCQTVSKWERDESMPDAALLPKLADALNCSLDRLFDRSVTRYPDAAGAAKDWLLTLDGSERWEGALRLGRIVQTVLCGFWERELPGAPLTAEFYDRPDILTGLCTRDEGITFSSRREELPFLVLLPEPEAGWLPLLAEDEPGYWEALADGEVRRVLKRFFAGELPARFDRSWALEQAGWASPEETMAGLERLGAFYRFPVRIDEQDTELYEWRSPPQLLTILLLGTVKKVNDQGFGSPGRRAPILRSREKDGEDGEE